MLNLEEFNKKFLAQSELLENLIITHHDNFREDCLTDYQLIPLDGVNNTKKYVIALITHKDNLVIDICLESIERYYRRLSSSTGDESSAIIESIKRELSENIFSHTGVHKVDGTLFISNTLENGEVCVTQWK